MEGYVSYDIIQLDYEPINDNCTSYRLKKYSGNIIFYQINCINCSAKLFNYQKDGNEPLLRCYDDRIQKRFPTFSLTNKLEIQCILCQTIISQPMSLYIKRTDDHYEERNAYVLN